MQKTVDVSVIVPIYNVEKYIGKCLDSLVAQTLKNYEIIVVNDGTKDNSAKIAEKYAKKYDNIQVIHKENQGLPQARKTGVENAKGKYISFLDSDDWVEKNMLFELLKAIKDFDADMVCCNYVLEYENHRVSQKIGNEGSKIFSKMEAITELHIRKSVFQFAWNKLYKKELFEDIIFPKEHVMGEDYFIVVQAICASSKIVKIPQFLCHYLQRDTSMCREGYNPNHLIAFENFEKIKCGLISRYPKLEEVIINYQIQEDIILVISMCRNNCYNKEMIKSVVKIVRKNIFMYLLKTKDSILCKGSAILICVSPKLLFRLYKRWKNI